MNKEITEYLDKLYIEDFKKFESIRDGITDIDYLNLENKDNQKEIFWSDQTF